MEDNITDLRIVRTREKIYSSLITLLHNNKFEEIFVKDICKLAGISRGTFYLHYQDKYELVSEYQFYLMSHAKSHFEHHKYESLRDFVTHAIAFWESEGELLLLLLSSRGSSEIQQQVKVALQKHMEVNLLPFITRKNMSKKNERYFLVFISNAILGVLQEWVDNGKQETLNELIDIIDEITTNILK